MVIPFLIARLIDGQNIPHIHPFGRRLNIRSIELHRSSEHPDDPTSTEELRQQIKVQQALIDDLVILTARYWRATPDRSAQGRRIIEAAKELGDAPKFPTLPGS